MTLVSINKTWGIPEVMAHWLRASLKVLPKVELEYLNFIALTGILVE